MIVGLSFEVLFSANISVTCNCPSSLRVPDFRDFISTQTCACCRTMRRCATSVLPACMSLANTTLETAVAWFCLTRVVLRRKISTWCEHKSLREKIIKDSAELFTSDIPKRRAQKPEFAKVLFEHSVASVEWFMDKFSLDLSLSGHSAPWTHRAKERFPGMTITYALLQMVDNIADKQTSLPSFLLRKTLPSHHFF